MAVKRVADDERRDTGVGLRISPVEKDMVRYICKRNDLYISDMMRKLIRDEYYKLKKEETV